MSMRKSVFWNQMSVAVLTVILLSSVHRACGEYYAYDGRRNNLQHAEWGFGFSCKTSGGECILP